jgi:cytidylate kinase
MPVIAMTREMGSHGSAIAQEVARRLGYEFLRNDLLRDAAREYRVRESRLVGVVEERRGSSSAFRRPRLRYRTYLEAAVLEAAAKDRVVLVGRWSTIFLRGIGHALRVRVCAPPATRAQRVMDRHRIGSAEALQRIAAYDDGVRARMRQMFDVDWTDPLLYDLVINTETIGVMTAVEQVLALVSAPEFQPTSVSRQLLVRSDPGGAGPGDRQGDAGDLAGGRGRQATDGHVRLAGLVGSEAERESVLVVAREVPGVRQVSSDVKVFRRPVR